MFLRVPSAHACVFIFSTLLFQLSAPCLHTGAWRTGCGHNLPKSSRRRVLAFTTKAPGCSFVCGYALHLLSAVSAAVASRTSACQGYQGQRAIACCPVVAVHMWLALMLLAARLGVLLLRSPMYPQTVDEFLRRHCKSVPQQDSVRESLAGQG